eukprot:g3344.t1
MAALKLPANSSTPSSTAMTPQTKDALTSSRAVAEQFCHQYYTVFSSYSRYLYRFYDKSSVQSITEIFEDGTSKQEFANTQKAIQDAIARLFSEARAHYEHVNSQFSQNGGVLIQVSGTLSRKGHKESNFVQSFFLAVQERGFFVLNDILNITPCTGFAKKTNSKSLNESKPQPSSPGDGLTTMQLPKLTSRPSSDPEQISQILAETKKMLIKVHSPSAEQVQRKLGHSFSEVVVNHCPNQQHSTETMNGCHQKTSSCGDVVGAMQNGFLLPSRSRSALGGGVNCPKNSSVFVRDIPLGATESDLRTVFEEFGTVNSVVIRTGKRDSRFAFVEFADTSSMEKALVSDSVAFQGRRLGIQEKKPIVIRNKPKYPNLRTQVAMELTSRQSNIVGDNKTNTFQK